MDPSPDALPAAVRRGVPWVIAGQVAGQVISLVALAILYRLLEPQAFGLLGMALPFVMLPRTLATLGLSAAAVQRHSLSHDERSLVFWLQTVVGLVVTAGTWLVAEPAAQLYGVDEVAPLVRWLSASVLIASLSATHQAILERRLRLARVTVVRVVGQFLGAAAAIVAAARGWGPEALVVQQYGELLTLLVTSWLAEPWLPARPRLRGPAGLFGPTAQGLLNFGGYYSLSSLLFVLAQHVDKLLLGLWLGDTAGGQAVVGAYTQAYNLMMRPVYLVTTPVSGVLLPALSRAAGEPALFARLAQNAYRLTAIALVPASIGLLITGPDLLEVLGGAPWRMAGVLLAAMAPTIAMHGWINLCGSLLAARGKAGLLCFGAVMLLLVTLQATAAGYWFGAQANSTALAPALGMAWGLSLAITGVLGVPYVSICALAAGLRPLWLLSTMRRPLAASAAMGVVVTLADRWLPAASDEGLILRVFLLVALGVTSYAGLAYPDVKWLWRRERVDDSVLPAGDV